MHLEPRNVDEETGVATALDISSYEFRRNGHFCGSTRIPGQSAEVPIAPPEHIVARVEGERMFEAGTDLDDILDGLDHVWPGSTRELLCRHLQTQLLLLVRAH